MGYTKLFHSIITSTIWTEDDRTRIVWITMLACADKNGEVTATIPGLARIAGVPVEDCRAAIARFLSPDPDSRTKDEEGRRVEEIDGGWSLLNFRKYREKASREEYLASNAARQARYRAKAKQHATPVTPVTPDQDRHVPVTAGMYIAESDTEAEPSGTDLSTDQGSAKPPRRRGRTGPRPPNAYEQAWYDATRAHFWVEPAKLAPHGSIALGRLGKAFGAAAIASKLKALLADEKLRKFATPKYLEDHWDSLPGGSGLFEKTHVPPAFLAEAREVLAMGPPPKGNANAEGRWKAILAGMAKYGLSEDDVRRSA